MRVLLPLLFAGSALGLLTDAEYQTRWETFKKDFKRAYQNAEEHDHRFGIFKANVDTIEEHNAKKLSYWLGVNDFADLTSEEWAKQMSCGNVTNPNHNPDMTETLYEMPEPINVTANASAVGIDWVQMGYVTAVKNQAQCGGCWSFATTGAIESRFAIAQRARPVELSEQELIDCSASYGNLGCNGGVTDYGFQYVMNEHGLCTESSYPYTATTQSSMCDSRRNSCGSHMDPIRSYQDVRRSENNLQNAVNTGPVTVAIEANSAFQLYRGGVFTGQCGTRLNHGVLAVGYGTDASTGLAYWKVKNSWGPTWGESGYIRMWKNSGQNGALGQCGISQQASYPVV